MWFSYCTAACFACATVAQPSFFFFFFKDGLIPFSLLTLSIIFVCLAYYLLVNLMLHLLSFSHPLIHLLILSISQVAGTVKFLYEITVCLNEVKDVKCFVNCKITFKCNYCNIIIKSSSSQFLNKDTFHVTVLCKFEIESAKNFV